MKKPNDIKEFDLDGIKLRIVEQDKNRLIIRSTGIGFDYMEFEISKSELTEIMASPKAGEKWMIFTRPARERKTFLKELERLIERIPRTSHSFPIVRDTMVY